MTTKLVTSWNTESLSTKNNDEFIRNYITSEVEHFVNGNDVSLVKNENSELLELIEKEFSKVSLVLEAERWIELDESIYFDKQSNGCWFIKKLSDDLDKDGFELHDHHYDFPKNTSIKNTNLYLTKIVIDPINKWSIPDFNIIDSLIPLAKNMPIDIAPHAISEMLCIKNNAIKIINVSNISAHQGSLGFLNALHKEFQEKTPSICFPYLYFLNKNKSSKSLFLNFIEKGFTPKALKNSLGYEILLSIFHYQTDFKNDNKLNKLNKREKAASLVFERECKALPTKQAISILLNEDHIRADIAPYHEKILEDTELGHWSLWPSQNKKNSSNPIQFNKSLVARDPNSSVNNGVVGIDFGTKSTVVVYQKDNVNIHPMRIGTGDLSKKIEAYQYENPTIMEFNDLERFIKDYQSETNKPRTRWQDLTISHTAQNSMQGCPSHQFNTFLDELKQWAGDKNRKLKIHSKDGMLIDLPPFLDLKDADFNPIEIYAYYLGLYINNQNNGIYLNYILSFPVTYELPICNKMIKSFEKGLKKSLPIELGEQTLSTLKVIKGASEPAAYALVALQAFEFDPCDDDRIFYSVFDFGGGTTDFDFGIYREANAKDERRFDYAVEHFGAGGDRYLGGENLLELLAFFIFKKNKNLLLDKGIQFEKPPEQDTFAGGEQLISNSQEAKSNTKNLCAVLRPFWEGVKEGGLDLSEGSISLSLTDKNGQMYAIFELDVNEEALNIILHDRIERGVVNFFEALRLAFSNSKTSLSDIDSIKIFLAGNASKSHFVKEIFDAQITLQLKSMGLNVIDNKLFELFNPLGMNDGNNVDIEKPTGKTGVAFGLIESRPGGRIKVIDNNVIKDDIRFKFYVGENRKRKFKVVIDREIPLHEWVEFIDASYPDFEFFFTDQPNASNGNMPINDSALKKVMFELDVIDDQAMVYLRVTSPTKIEYVVAHPEQIKQGAYLNQINSVELSL